MDAPYSGGFSPGATRFAVDGDFTIAKPAGPPEISNPFPGDSVPNIYPIVILDRSLAIPDYEVVPVGSGFNLQPFAASQSAIIIEQEFMVAEEFHRPLPLNTYYDINWSVGWGNNYVGLGDCFLVEEGPLVGLGGGLVRFKRKFASLPPNRNEFESSCVNYPGIQFAAKSTRLGFSKIVDTRVFNEYFVFDNLDLLAGIPLFPGGHRINTGTIGANAQYLLIEDTKYFAAAANAALNNILLPPDAVLSDAAGDGDFSSIPSATTYKSWMGINEIVAEASSFNRWLGNIFVRRTRFAVAQ